MSYWGVLQNLNPKEVNIFQPPMTEKKFLLLNTEFLNDSLVKAIQINAVNPGLVGISVRIHFVKENTEILFIKIT